MREADALTTESAMDKVVLIRGSSLITPIYACLYHSLDVSNTFAHLPSTILGNDSVIQDDVTRTS